MTESITGAAAASGVPFRQRPKCRAQTRFGAQQYLQLLDRQRAEDFRWRIPLAALWHFNRSRSLAQAPGRKFVPVARASGPERRAGERPAP
jgi:hypothetical protein